jgi:hypothetical protein
MQKFIFHTTWLKGVVLVDTHTFEEYLEALREMQEEE